MALLDVRSLIKNYGRRRVVDGICFHVNAGEVVGLLGPNGAGKTTSFRMTTGQITPNSGAVWFNEQDVTKLPMFRRARLGMGYLSQETSVFRRLNVEQNILAVLEVVPMIRSLGRRPTSRERRQRTEEVLEQFGLTHVRKNNAARLSGGEKRRLEIARCLVCEPLLILLDEPFTGIDPKTIGDIQQIVRQLRDAGIGVLLTDHNVREALKITDRSYLIKDGTVRTHGSPEEIINDPVAIQEYLGHSFHEDIVTASKRRSDIAPPQYHPPQTTSVPMNAASVAPFKASIPGLIEQLKSPARDQAFRELVALGETVVPILLDTLERRDVDLRRMSLEILQTIYQTEIPFDPFAPEAHRHQQLRTLREHWERKAG